MFLEAFVPNACLFDFGPRHKYRSTSRRSTGRFDLLAITRKIREVRGARGGMRRILFGLWLSLVERLVRDQEAVGSNPTSPM
jgi:hypothetical protein